MTQPDERFLQSYMAKPLEIKFEESPYAPFFDNLMGEIEDNYREKIVGCG